MEQSSRMIVEVSLTRVDLNGPMTFGADTASAGAWHGG